MRWLIALALVGCTDLQADEPPRIRPAAEYRSDHVDEAIERASRRLRTRGLSDEGEDVRGFLAPHSTHVIDVSLGADDCIVVLASATPGLRDLELRAYDSDGSEIARDEERGASASLELCAPHAGTFYLAARATSGAGLFALRRMLVPPGIDVRRGDLFAPETDVRGVATP